MGAPSVADIIKSGAMIYIAPAGEALPDETTVAAGASWGGTWVRVGYTKEPLTVEYEPEEHEVEVEEHLAPVDRWKTKESLRMETVLAEFTPEYIEIASGNDLTLTTTAAGASQKAYQEVTVGDNPLLKKWAVGIEGIRYSALLAAQPLRIFVYRATVKFNGELEFSKKSDDYTGIPIQIQALSDTANSGRLFTTQVVTAAASS
jgi:hypothetical protein